MASPLSTMSRSSKFRIPSPSGTTNSSGTGTDHTSSTRYSSHGISPKEKQSALNLEDDDDYYDEPVTQAPQLSALARMLLSESPKPAPKSSSPPRTHIPYTTKARQKLSWGQTTEYETKNDDAEVASPKDDDTSPAYRISKDFVTPAPRVRTTRPFAGAYYGAPALNSGGEADAQNDQHKEPTTTMVTSYVPESALRTQLGSAARWKRNTGRGTMAGLGGAPRRGGIRRESSDQADEERAEESGSHEPGDYAAARRQSGEHGAERRRSGSPPLRAASRAQQGRGASPGPAPRGREASLPGSRGSTPEAKGSRSPTPSAHRAQPGPSTWSRRGSPEYQASDPKAREVRGSTPDLKRPISPAPATHATQPSHSGWSRRASPEYPEKKAKINEEDRQSPTPQENVRPAYSRFARRAPSVSGYSRHSDPSVGSSSRQGTPPLDKENMAPPVYRRSTTVSPPPPKLMSASSNEDLQAPPSPSKAPKMSALVPVPTQVTPEAKERNALANRDRNTPHRPAPPPPKMNMMKTATAVAGAVAAQSANTRSRRSQVIINGRQYRRLDLIGKGGSSKVYKVMAENFRVFALKKVTFNDEDDAQSAILGYKGEIELLTQLAKVDRVIRLFDYEINDEKGHLLMLMEAGETDLAKLLQAHYASEDPKLDISFTRHYWREMLLCVQAVHALNIIHSDLKPANFLVVQGRLKLIDFGIANAIVGDTVNVHRESQVGTVNYMSPEALTDVNHTPTGRTMQGIGPSRLMKLGAPSDVWSLGCILYQMCYGRAPFAHISTMYKRLAAIPNPHHEIEYPDTGIGGKSVPRSAIITMQDCLHREKNDRATIEQLLSDDDCFLFPDKRKEGTVEISEETLRRMLENAVEYTSKGAIPDKNTVKAWASSIYGKLEAQGRRRPPPPGSATSSASSSRT